MPSAVALVGLACYLGLVPFHSETLQFEGIVRRHLEIMTGAGIVAGVVYWLIAGRNAGAWRQPLPPRQPPPPLPSNSPAGCAVTLSFRAEDRPESHSGSVLRTAPE